MIEVQKYNPQWSNRFQSLSSQFIPHIKNLSLEVMHLGSTSIKGLSSDPTVDISIVVEDFSGLSQISEKLRLVGYIPQGDAVEQDHFVFKHNKSVPHSLKIVKKDSLLLKSQILLKKHLEENPTALNEYETVKKKLINKKISLEKFLVIEKKLIENYLIAEGFTSDELAEVL